MSTAEETDQKRQLRWGIYQYPPTLAVQMRQTDSLNNLNSQRRASSSKWDLHQELNLHPLHHLQEESPCCLQWMLKEIYRLIYLAKLSILSTSAPSSWGIHSCIFFPTVQLKCSFQVGVQIANMILGLICLFPTINTGRGLHGGKYCF